LLDRYRLPQPRNVLAEILRRHASAAMDVSDGLAGDLGKLCRASGVSADIIVEQVPLSPAARAALAAEAALIETILTGGDDYEVVCTVPASKSDAFHAASATSGVVVTDIGQITTGEGAPRLLAWDGKPLALGHLSYSHF
jgi:thiamine-monophosphate kinase